jgi:hypothetical protein
MSLEAILQALGAKDEADAIGKALEATKFAADLMTATGTRSLDDALASVRGSAKLLGSLETLTGQKPDAALGVVTAWKGSHEQLPAAQAALADATGKLEGFELESMIAKAKLDKKLTPDGETKFRASVKTGTFNLKQGAAFLDMLHPVPALANAAVIVQPAVEGAGPAGAAFADLTGKLYEDLSADQLANLRQRDGGETAYQNLRSDWESRGKPKKKAA